MTHSFRDFCSILRHRSLLAILLLGIISGMPIVLTGSTLAVWMMEQGITKSAIGYMVMVSLPYTFKFLWAPLCDIVTLPFARYLGHRRSWMLLLLCPLILSVMWLSQGDVLAHPVLFVSACVAITFFSASFDIALDAYRIELLPLEEQGIGAFAVTTGYRIGMLIAGAGALLVADYWGWKMSYMVMSLALISGLAIILFAPRVTDTSRAIASSLSDHIREYTRAFTSITAWPYWVVIVVFVITFKLPDAFAGVMTNPFLIEMGFTKTEIALISKTYGTFATMGGMLLGAMCVYRYALVVNLYTAIALQILSNLGFIALYYAGHDLMALGLVIGVENICGGISSAILITYFSSLCRAPYTATHYGVLSAVVTMGRTMLSSQSGVLADSMSWPLFFIISIALGLPSLLILYRYQRQITGNSNRP